MKLRNFTCVSRQQAKQAQEEQQMNSVIRNGTRHPAIALAVGSGVLIALSLGGCADAPGNENDELVEFASTEQSITAAGDGLPGTDATAFAEAKAAFETQEEIEDGVGPVMNDIACVNCHLQGATGGASTKIERRFGRFVNGVFDDLANRGGSLRQLQTVGPFTGLNGASCNPPLEREPTEATVHNVGRLATPLFGAGLIDSLPDSAITVNQQNQPTGQRGTINRVTNLLPNPDDPGQTLNGTRVGRFGWKAGVASLAQFSADAYINEMGITTQHCIKGTSVLAFARESRPNGLANPAGCDDLAPPNGGAALGIPAETDDVVGSCAGGLSELQDDVDLFFVFMTRLAPAPRLAIDPNVNLQGGTVFNRIGCATCHLLRDYVTPSRPGNGVPGNFSFRPRTDFLVHDIGTGDSIGNDGDSVATTNRIRTAPLWGLHHRTLFLHDGRATSIEQAISFHRNQADGSRIAFNNLNASDRAAMLAAMKSD
jgi:CxxC motif-containing protein (DUF1111 family)